MSAGTRLGGIKFKNRIQWIPRICGELILFNFFSFLIPKIGQTSLFKDLARKKNPIIQNLMGMFREPVPGTKRRWFIPSKNVTPRSQLVSEKSNFQKWLIIKRGGRIDWIQNPPLACPVQLNLPVYDRTRLVRPPWPN